MLRLFSFPSLWSMLCRIDMNFYTLNLNFSFSYIAIVLCSHIVWKRKRKKIEYLYVQNFLLIHNLRKKEKHIFARKRLMCYRMMLYSISVFSVIFIYMLHFINIFNGFFKKNLSCTLTSSPGTGFPALSWVQWAAVNMSLNKVVR